jgi:quercetin dioxygenase-like cupin family protein
MYVNNYHEIDSKTTDVEGLTERWVINKEHGAINFSMRLLELEPTKSTHTHTHSSEHEVFVLVGLGNVEGEDGKVYQIREGSVVYIAPNETHKFNNTGASKLRMIDVVMFTSRIAK